MFVFRGFFCGLFLLFMPDFGFAAPMYKIFGGSVVLNPGHTSGKIDSVTWKHNADLALEWFGQEITCYRTFKGRCHLNETTGSFTITNLTVEDSGEYTPEINSVVGGMMELQVIKPVPKPTVSKDCNNEKTVCNLTCKANISAEFGPVSYQWKTGDTELSKDKELRITTENKESSFYCMLINLVSNSTSDEISDPISRGNNYAIVIVLVILFVFGVAVIGAFFLNRAGHLPFLNKIFPCNKTTRNAAQKADVNSTTVQIPEENQDDLVNAAAGELEKLLRSETETNQDQVAVTPIGGFHPVSQENDQDNAASGNENKSKGKAALNGYQPANVNDNGMNNINQTDVSTEQQQQDPPTEPVCDDEGESGQKSESEETEPTAEGPEKPKDSTCDPPVDTQPEKGFSQESNLGPPAVSPELSCQTDSL